MQMEGIPIYNHLGHFTEDNYMDMEDDTYDPYPIPTGRTSRVQVSIYLRH